MVNEFDHGPFSPFVAQKRHYLVRITEENINDVARFLKLGVNYEQDAPRIQYKWHIDDEARGWEFIKIGELIEHRPDKLGDKLNWSRVNAESLGGLMHCQSGANPLHLAWEQGYQSHGRGLGMGNNPYKETEEDD